jgi:aerobic carbon-monoxide dehydrogenase medium subunit
MAKIAAYFHTARLAASLAAKTITTRDDVHGPGRAEMIPGNFTYHRPDSKTHALELLGQFGDDGRVLAGGHSLIPMMKLRLASPAHLIDITRLDELKGISIGAGIIEIGAGVTQHALIASDELAAACPIIREAATQIADPQVRYVGTVGGNVGGGDPGNDLPGVMQCLDATYVLERVGSRREVPARDFYRGPFFTALDVGEMVTRIRLSVPPAGHGHAYKKLKRKVGDYAMAAAAVILEMSGGTVRDAAIALTNVGPTPLFARAASDRITGSMLEAADIDAAAAAAQAITSPADDGKGSVEYRMTMAGVMVRRALIEAKARAFDVKPSGGGVFGWLRG